MKHTTQAKSLRYIILITSQIAGQIKLVGGLAQVSARGSVRHHIGNQRHLDYLIYSLFTVITNEASKLRITDPVRRESPNDT